MGKLHQADGLWSQAEHEFTVALSFDPVHRPSQAAMVKILFDSGQSAKAKLSADFYINQASTSDVGSLDLGIAFQKEGLDDYALTCYQKALSLAPSSAQANKQARLLLLKERRQRKGKGLPDSKLPDRPLSAGCRRRTRKARRGYPVQPDANTKCCSQCRKTDEIIKLKVSFLWPCGEWNRRGVFLSANNTGISLYFFRKIFPLADIILVGNVKKRGSDPPQAGPKMPVFLPSFIGP